MSDVLEEIVVADRPVAEMAAGEPETAGEVFVCYLREELDMGDGLAPPRLVTVSVNPMRRRPRVGPRRIECAA